MLESKTALKCFIIGIGNAGNQLVNEAYKSNFDVYAVNTSKKDMDDSVIIKEIRGFVVGNEARGAGKSRDTAKELFKVNGRDLFESTPTFTESCSRSDVIIVTGSTAGGSGSGLAPIFIKFLKRLYPNKIILYYGILPRLTESPNAQENATACLAEIQQLNIPYLLADLDHYKGVSNDIAYTKMIAHIIDGIQVINCKYINKSSFGMIDENDMRTVIAEPGYMSIYNLDKVTQQQIDQKSLQSMMISKIKSSPAVEIMRDGIIRHMAAIINMPEELTDSSKAGDYTELTSYIGSPYAVFENYTITNTATGQLIIILSGQTVPYNRISLMDEIVRKHREIESKKKDYNLMTMVEEQGATNKNVPDFLKASTKTAEEKQAELNRLFDEI